MSFSRQEYWSGLSFPSPGDLPDPGVEPVSLMSPALTGRFFTTRATWEAKMGTVGYKSRLEKGSVLASQPFYLPHTRLIMTTVHSWVESEAELG